MSGLGLLLSRTSLSRGLLVVSHTCSPAGSDRRSSRLRFTNRVAFCLAILVAWLPVHVRAERPLPGNDELPATIRRILDATPLAQSRTGILVYDLEAGRPVFEHNADELLNPASNMKIVTTVAALSVLGPGHRFATEILVDEEPVGGILKGNLYLRGKGDPSLDTERLFRVVRELRFLGLKEIQGAIVVDDTYFDDQYDGPGWEQDDSDRPYMAGAGAVSLNFNAVGVHVHPGEKAGGKARIGLDPPSDYLILEDRTETAPPSGRQRIEVKSLAEGNRQRIVVSAWMPLGRRGGVFYRRISHPALYTGETLKAMLGEQGVTVKGKVRLGATPARLRPWYVTHSEPLAVLIHKLNKWSQNHMSEMLLKTLGAEVHGAPGTWAKGASAVEDFLAREVKIPRGSLVMRNGSGLNDTNRISARQIVQILSWARNQLLVAPELLTSLPVAGVDGTTRNRMGGTPAEGRVRAKTGTLQNVTALSGYATSLGGRAYAFAVVVNDYPGRLSRIIPGVDAIGTAMAAVGSPGGGDAAIALSRPPANEPSTPLEILGARMTTFAQLGGAADARNTRFLRTALRSERDPALRLAIAEALHLSDRRDGEAVGTFLEAFSATPEVYGRLRQAARIAGLGVPLVDSLIDVAATGNQEALSALFQLAALDPADAEMEVEIAHGLVEIGRTAPSELLLALNAAPGETRSLAIRLMGLALAGDPQKVKTARGSRPQEPGQNFAAGLTRAAAGGDPSLVAFARSLEEQLAASVAEAREPIPGDGAVPES